MSDNIAFLELPMQIGEHAYIAENQHLNKVHFGNNYEFDI